MDKTLRTSIETLLKGRRGFEFEALIKELYLIRHGASGFQPTRERSDEGADGIILDSKTVIASYGPDLYNEKEFIKKVTGDYASYIKNWATKYPHWRLCYNGALSPAAIKLIYDELGTIPLPPGTKVESITVNGSDQIVRFIEDEFTNKQIREFAYFIGVPKELIVFDHIRALIDDLLKDAGDPKEEIDYKAPVDIEEKIKLNYSKKDAEAATEEYQTLAIDGILRKIWGILSIYGTEEITALKHRIKREFNNQSGTFKSKLEGLTNLYVAKYANESDDDFVFYTRALLIYCFEQCMIGKRTAGETENERK
jgi:hypothetical protein